MTLVCHCHNFAFIASSIKTWVKVTIKIRVIKTRNMKLGMAAHACGSSSQEAEQQDCSKFRASLGYITKCEASQEDTVRLSNCKEKQRM